MKRYAARVLHKADGTLCSLMVVEVDKNVVAACYPLDREQSSTVWLPGELLLASDAHLQLLPAETLEHLLLRASRPLLETNILSAYHVCCWQGQLSLTRLDG